MSNKPLRLVTGLLYHNRNARILVFSRAELVLCLVVSLHHRILAQHSSVNMPQSLLHLHHGQVEVHMLVGHPRLGNARSTIFKRATQAGLNTLNGMRSCSSYKNVRTRTNSHNTACL
jgi:hypothetical protein